MTAELWLVLWSAALLVVYVLAQASIANSVYGTHFTVTSRDSAPPPNPPAERAKRAIYNLLETYPAFVALMLVAHLAVPGDSVVFWGGVVWLAARVAYLPLYVLNVVGIRSLAWIIGLCGLIAIFIGILV